MHHGEIRLSVQLFVIMNLQDSPGSAKTTHCLARSVAGGSKWVPPYPTVAFPFQATMTTGEARNGSAAPKQIPGVLSIRGKKLHHRPNQNPACARHLVPSGCLW